MLIKCYCNHCSTHLEFEAGNEGEVIACPSCGLDTKLYAPPPPPPPPPKPIEPPKTKPPLSQTIPDPKKKPASRSRKVEDTLDDVRADSCYKTLRGLIALIQVLWIICAVIVGFVAILQAFVAISDRVNPEIIYSVFMFLSAVASIVVAVALKQAALLLVDIADCQIQQVNRAK